MKQPSTKSIKLEFAPGENVTAFGGMAVLERLLSRLGVPSKLRRALPARGGYAFDAAILAAVAGLLSGAFGTAATTVLREDPALLRLAGLEEAPTDVTFWRVLGDLSGEANTPPPLPLFEQAYDLGRPSRLAAQTQTVPGVSQDENTPTSSAAPASAQAPVLIRTAACGLAALERATLQTGRRAISATSRTALYDCGFIPVFIDGTLLEGSLRREGTKTLGDKGRGLLYTAAFVGPYPVAGELAAEGTGEAAALRRLLPRINAEVLRPNSLCGEALVLADSLHGNGPTLELIEGQELAYVIGANGLNTAQSVLSQQPDFQWEKTPDYDRARGVEESGVCLARIRCEGWSQGRLLVGRRWKSKGELIWNYAAVLTNLSPEDPRVRAIMSRENTSFAEAIWLLYNRKGACENHFKNLLTDLGLHHPPCQAWGRNAAFYAIGLLAALVGVASDVLGSAPGKRRRRLATLRRWLFAVPARITRSGRVLTATILGLSERWRTRIEEAFGRLARC